MHTADDLRRGSEAFPSSSAVSEAFRMRCGVENVMARNLLIKVEFWCDRRVMRFRAA